MTTATPAARLPARQDALDTSSPALSADAAGVPDAYGVPAGSGQRGLWRRASCSAYEAGNGAVQGGQGEDAENGAASGDNQ